MAWLWPLNESDRLSIQPDSDAAFGLFGAGGDGEKKGFMACFGLWMGDRSGCGGFLVLWACTASRRVLRGIGRVLCCRRRRRFLGRWWC